MIHRLLFVYTLVFVPLAQSNSIFEVNDTFTLKAYPNDSEVYIKIEARSDHPYVKTAYVISYHGLCKTSKYSINSNMSIKSYLSPSLISEEALKKSIKSKTTVKENAYKCEGEKFDTSKDIAADALKNFEIQITQLDENLSLLEETSFFKIVKGDVK
jgi:hypothetical protein